MRRYAKASSAGSISSSGESHGVVDRADIGDCAAPGPKGIGAHRSHFSRAILTVLAVGAFTFLVGPGSSSAALVPPALDSVTNVAYDSVHATGMVDTDSDVQTYWVFEVSSDGGASWSPEGCLFCNFLPGADDPVPVESDLLGLKGGTHYEVRLTVSKGDPNDVAHSPGPNPTFTTLPVDPPKVLSVSDASGVSYTTANASGAVERPANPSSPPFDPTSAFDAKCFFEYVPDAEFAATGFENALQAGCEPENPITTPDGNAATLPVTASLTELAPGTAYHLRLGASNAGGTDAQVAANTFSTLAVSPPSVSNLQASGVAATSAQLSADINPLAPVGDPAFEVSWHFQCAPDCPGLEGGTISPDNVSHPISVSATGLQPNTSYEVNLVASNRGGDTSAGPIFFKTVAPKPAAQTLGAGMIKEDAATMAARINPLNSPVTYQFEWGVDDNYGAKVPALAQILTPSDNTFHSIGAQITGLQPATTYHYRIIAMNTQTGEVSDGIDRVFTTLGAALDPACPNESSRRGPAAGLPNCRAYEWVTPGMNGVGIEAARQGVSSALPDGSALRFVTVDAPDDAEGSTVYTWGLAQKGPLGWTTKSLAPPTPEQSARYLGAVGPVLAISADFSETVVLSRQALAGPSTPSGQNVFIHRADGKFQVLTTVGSEGWLGLGSNVQASGDFSHVYFTPRIKQTDADPIQDRNTYEWADGNLSLLGVLPGPGHDLAPEGAYLADGALPAISNDGSRAIFSAVGFPGLYLHIDGEDTVEVSTYAGTADPGPASAAQAKAVGINADGTKVLFTSQYELTDDANTGMTNGVPNNQGNDLYSYDVQARKLTDLTVAVSPADARSGANVLSVVGASPDASYVYFTATGDLAPGAISGEVNLYSAHNGEVSFIAPAGGLYKGPGDPEEQVRPFYVTPNGLHVAFMSTDSLTGYENISSETGESVTEVYTYTYGGALECASCRPDGSPPSAGSQISTYSAFQRRGQTAAVTRAMSDDGTRVFFQSPDAVVPQASNGLPNVFEFESGRVHLLSTGDGRSPAILLDASASGDDVFIYTHDELDWHETGRVDAIFDARAGADVAPPLGRTRCQAAECRGGGTSPSAGPTLGTATGEFPRRIFASVAISGRKARLRVVVPGAGRMSITGAGLVPLQTRIQRAGSVVVRLSLRNGANRVRLKRGGYKTRATVRFVSAGGQRASILVPLKFPKSSNLKGGK